ncbi:MAG: hypothetical protein ACLP9L_01750 [Thermoguttaceae bacterium]
MRWRTDSLADTVFPDASRAYTAIYFTSVRKPEPPARRPRSGAAASPRW